MSRFTFFILPLFLFSLAFAQDRPSDTAVLRDAKEYSDMLVKIGKLKIDDQVDAWQTFLSDHPNQSFRKEIEKNIERLESLSSKKVDKKHGDEKDAELYLKAIEYAKKLNTSDQVLMWQQFIEENPTNIYRDDAKARLYKLKRTMPRVQAVPQATQVSPAPGTTSTQTPLASQKKSESTSVGGIRPVKDRDKAILYAWLPGLVVPGMAHWYTEDYLIASVLTAIRVAGIAVGVTGIVQEQNEPIYIGTGLAVLSYAIDIADAPYSADRFNEKRAKAYLLPQEQHGKTYPLFSYNFKF